MKEDIFLNILALILLVGVFFVVTIFFKLGQIGTHSDEECAKLNNLHESTKEGKCKNNKT